MVALQIEDLKLFTSQLFIGELFDSFLIRELSITTFNHFSMNGKIKKDYYSESEQQENNIQEYSEWRVLKPFCYSLIKGKRLPEYFQIQMQLSQSGIESFIKRRQVSVSGEHIQGLHLAIRYENGQLCCVTGTSLNIFTMDKSVENEWDAEIKEFLKMNKITFC